MPLLQRVRERFFPRRVRYRVFEDLGIPHEVVVTIYQYPFRHIVIDGFLPPAQYKQLSSDFAQTLAKGLSETAQKDRFSRFDLYDLYAQMPEPTLELPYGCFFAGTYFQMLERALGRVFSRDTFATFHHHAPNPQDNYIHTDYVYEYFRDEPLPNGINPWYHQCDKHRPSPGARPVVRAAAAIYYLNNEWVAGQGGETGIFATKEARSLVRRLAPVNNRLIAFDITPTSYHNYMACALPARNSLAQWFYVSEGVVAARFPRQRPGGWEKLHEDTTDPYERLLRVNLGCCKGERIAILADTVPLTHPTAELPTREALAERLASAARHLGAQATVISYEAQADSPEPPPSIEGALYQAGSETPVPFDIVLMVGGRSLTHTRFRQRLSRTRRLRMASMPGVEPHMFTGVLAADWAQVAARSRVAAGRLSRATLAEIQTESSAGTHTLRLSLAGREADAGTGLLATPGSFGNLPGGEASLAPLEDSAEGEIAIGRERVCVMRFAEGAVASIEGEPLARELAEVFARIPAARGLAELGIGTNERASDEHHILEAEKILGTVHIALGDNTGFGGTRAAPYHRDFVAFSPTLTLEYADGTHEVLLKEGAWCSDD